MCLELVQCPDLISPLVDLCPSTWNSNYITQAHSKTSSNSATILQRYQWQHSQPGFNFFIECRNISWLYVQGHIGFRWTSRRMLWTTVNALFMCQPWWLHKCKGKKSDRWKYILYCMDQDREPTWGGCSILQIATQRCYIRCSIPSFIETRHKWESNPSVNENEKQWFSLSPHPVSEKQVLVLVLNPQSPIPNLVLNCHYSIFSPSLPLKFHARLMAK